MTFLSRLRAELAHARCVYRCHSRLIELKYHFDRAPDPASAAVFAEHVAVRLRMQADSLQASWLARAAAALAIPAEIRAEADEWDRRAQVAKETTP